MNGKNMRYKFEEGVEDVGAIVSLGRAVRAHGPYGILIGDERLEFHSVVIVDPILTGHRLLIAAGVTQLRDYLVFQMLADGQLEGILPEEIVDLRIAGAEKFLFFRSDRTFHFFLNERAMDWGATHISGATLKRLAGIDVRGNDVWQQLHGRPDRLIHDDELIDLAVSGAECLVTKPASITIIVNTRPKELHHRRATYWEIVKLAFSDALPSENIIYSVDYTDGPHANPEGAMVEGQRVKLKDEMRFYVTPSDKS